MSMLGNALVGQNVGYNMTPRSVFDRARSFEEAQRQGLIPTMAEYPLAGRYLSNATQLGFDGVGGPSMAINPAQRQVVPIPQTPYRGDFPEDADLPPSKYGDQGGSQAPSSGRVDSEGNVVPEGVDMNNVYLIDRMRAMQQEAQSSEKYARDLAIFEDYATRMADKKQKYGLQSQLAGFMFKKLPDLMAEPARRRNRYLDDLVLSVGDQRLAANALTGMGVGNYRI